VSPAKLSPWWITRVFRPEGDGWEPGSGNASAHQEGQGYEAMQHDFASPMKRAIS